MPLALRGATTVDRDDPVLILDATEELLTEMLARNALAPEMLVSITFAVSGDLAAAFPARAARSLGWHDVPTMCVLSADAGAGAARCIRVMMHLDADRPRSGVSHVYLRGARDLRPDLRDV
jgi:chorismate mutase